MKKRTVAIAQAKSYVRAPIVAAWIRMHGKPEITKTTFFVMSVGNAGLDDIFLVVTTADCWQVQEQKPCKSAGTKTMQKCCSCTWTISKENECGMLNAPTHQERVI